eukprot:scaffold421188_cov47-Attheya_sp.AAC.3
MARDSDEYRRFDDGGHYGRDRSFSNASSSYTEQHVRSGNDWYGERSQEEEDGYYAPSSFRHEKEEDRRGFRDGRSSSSSRKQHDRNTSRGEPEPSSRQCEWPPSFESGGAAYVFDARSAFFYEAASDFFYDPKTKLYFSNKKQMYFQHVPGNHPPYEQLLPDETQQTTTTPGLTASSAGEQPTEAITSAADYSTNSLDVFNLPPSKVEKKNKIMISIKKKPSSIISDQRERSTQVKNNKANNDLPSTLKKSGDKSKAASSTLNEPLTLPQKVKKQPYADIAKWSRLGKETRSEGGDASVKKEAAAADKTSAINHATRPLQTGKPLSKGEEVKKTASGQPICLLCKRKFANTDKLRQHEQISKLHKDNLAKKNKAVDEAKKAATTNTQSQTMSGAVEYRDRAKERRGMFESVGTVAAVPPMNAAVQLGPSLTRPRNVVETQVVRPDEHLGDSNIGNKLLQKLGWKTGQSLGRKQSSATGTDQVGASSNSNDATQYLQQDWERIETMASSSSTGANNAGRRTRGNHQAGIGGDASKHNYYGST